VTDLPARQTVLVAAVTAAVKAVEGVGAEFGGTYGKSTSVVGPVTITVEVELKR
jgi:hypothetical protein